jgi:hypothetical protein
MELFNFYWRQQAWAHSAEVFSPVLHCFFPQIHCSFTNALEHLNFHTICTRRRHFDALFLVNIYRGYTFCLSLFETAGICVSYHTFRGFTPVTVGFKPFYVDYCIITQISLTLWSPMVCVHLFLTISNFAFCPQSVFMGFIWFLE